MNFLSKKRCFAENGTIDLWILNIYRIHILNKLRICLFIKNFTISRQKLYPFISFPKSSKKYTNRQKQFYTLNS